MKAKITASKFINEFESKFGILYSHLVEYDNKKAYYNSKSKDQTRFVPGKEAEFEEIEKEGKKGKFLVIKPIQSGGGGYSGNSNYAKDVKREQSKYSGFATSYVKDLIIADKIEMKDWEAASKKIFNFMVELDKNEEGTK